MELFDILKAFFSDKKWQDVTKQEKAKNFFMINRIMSISLPLQANAFNNTKIDPVSVIDFWKFTLNTKYKTPPGWFFTSTNKKEKKKEERRRRWGQQLPLLPSSVAAATLQLLLLQPAQAAPGQCRAR